MTEGDDGRVAVLEARVAELEHQVELLRAALPPVASLPAPPPPPPRAAAPPPSAGARPNSLDAETVLKWVGVGLVVLAIGFAVSTAVRRGWIGPELQLLGALGVSAALIVSGLRLRSRRPPWAHALCTGGVLGLFTTAASDLFVDQIGEGGARTVTVASATAGLALARRLDSQWVAAAVLGGGSVGWLVIGGTDGPFAATLAWFTALVVAGLFLAVVAEWFAIRAAAHALGMAAAIGLANEVSGAGEQIALLAAAAGLCASLVTIPSIRWRRAAWPVLELQLVVLGGPWALVVLLVTLGLRDRTGQGLVGFAVAAGFVITARLLRARLHPAHHLSLLLAGSIVLSIAMATFLAGPAALLGIAVQGAVLVVLDRRLGGDVRVAVNASALLFIAGTSTLAASVDAWVTNAPVGDDLAHLGVVLAMAAASVAVTHNGLRAMVAAAALGMLLIWLGSILVHVPQGQGAVSASWAVVGILVFVTGALRRLPGVGGVGLGVIALTVAKLLTVDLREVDALWRAALFFFVGIGLLRLGFLLPRWRDPAPSPRPHDDPQLLR